jgi:hypothetical protein
MKRKRKRKRTRGLAVGEVIGEEDGAAVPDGVEAEVFAEGGEDFGHGGGGELGAKLFLIERGALPGEDGLGEQGAEVFFAVAGEFKLDAQRLAFFDELGIQGLHDGQAGEGRGFGDGKGGAPKKGGDLGGFPRADLLQVATMPGFDDGEVGIGGAAAEAQADESEGQEGGFEGHGRGRGGERLGSHLEFSFMLCSRLRKRATMKSVLLSSMRYWTEVKG